MSNLETKILPSLDLPPEDETFAHPHFAPFSIAVSIENTTAGTTVSNMPPIKILQFLEHGLILEVIEKSCAPGHMMSITLQCTGIAESLVEFQVTGKIEVLEHFPDHTDQIQIKFIQYPEAPWDLLNHFLKSRQKHIGDFLAAAGGNE